MERFHAGPEGVARTLQHCSHLANPYNSIYALTRERRVRSLQLPSRGRTRPAQKPIIRQILQSHGREHRSSKPHRLLQSLLHAPQRARRPLRSPVR